MTQLTGCSPSKKEIVDKFDDFITMFPTEDLTVLYDKEGNTSGLPKGDLGTWVVSSYIYTPDDKKVGIVLGFNRNTREVNGNFILKEVKDGTRIKNEYPIYYDENEIHFVDENIEESIKEELSNFNIMYDFISINRSYIDNLESVKFSYNGEVPMYSALYKLTSDDVNIRKINDLYPELSLDEDNIRLELSGDGIPWNTNSMLSLEISLDASNNNYFISSMHLADSDSFNNLLEGE